MYFHCFRSLWECTINFPITETIYGAVLPIYHCSISSLSQAQKQGRKPCSTRSQVNPEDQFFGKLNFHIYQFLFWLVLKIHFFFTSQFYILDSGTAMHCLHWSKVLRWQLHTLVNTVRPERYSEEQCKRLSICLIPLFLEEWKLKIQILNFVHRSQTSEYIAPIIKTGSLDFKSGTFCIFVDIGIPQIPTKQNIYGKNSDNISQFLWK